MPNFSWIMANDSIKPKEGEVVNVVAQDCWDRKEKQFLAVYTSYKVHNEVKHVWSPLGSNPLSFDSRTVTHWCPRLEPPGYGSWKYSGMGD